LPLKLYPTKIKSRLLFELATFKQSYQSP
jgi:hypothetical protein